MRRLVCWCVGHTVVRHITAARLPSATDALFGAISIRIEPVDWYFECSRCGRRWSRDETLPISLRERMRW